jgi:guanylate kinase
MGVRHFNYANPPSRGGYNTPLKGGSTINNQSVTNMGKLIVLTGPSGVGKGTLLKSLLTKHPEIYLSISATTRSPRSGEIDGQHYYFLERQKFEEMIAAGELLEWAEFAGNCYGTPRQPVEQQIAQGKIVLLEIELQGARQVRQSFPQGTQIFILPPSVEELENRIRGRGQDSEAAISRRLKQAKIELAAADEFDIKIVNDNFDEALANLEAAIFG